MIYQAGTEMCMVRSCLALAESTEVQATGFYGHKITYPNGCVSFVDSLTGDVEYHSNVRKGAEYDPKNYKNNSALGYVTMLAYFTDAEGKTVYRKPTVHSMVTCLSEHNRELFYSAMKRCSVENGCNNSEAKVELHHIDCNSGNNSASNVLPCTPKEHRAIHKALKRGKSVYDSLVAGLGETLVHEIFGEDYFDYGDGGVYTASLFGEPYIARMVQQLSAANLPAGCDCIRVKTLQGRYECLSVLKMSVWEILTALYAVRATEIKSYCSGTNCVAID